MEDGQADWFFSVGGGFSTPGYGIGIDRGRSKVCTKKEIKGKTISTNLDFIVAGGEAIAPGWNIENAADRVTVIKGGYHYGIGLNFLWNYTFDIGD